MLEMRNGSAYVVMKNFVKKCGHGDNIPERILLSVLGCMEYGHAQMQEYDANGHPFKLIFDVEESYYIEHDKDGTLLGYVTKDIRSIGQELILDIERQEEEWKQYAGNRYEEVELLLNSIRKRVYLKK